MYLILSILSSSAIFVIFKLFDAYKINRLQAIIFNYATAFILGLTTSNSVIKITEIAQNRWFFYAIGMGLVFISIFNAMAVTAQRNGLSVVAVASKMSVVIPVVAGLVLYQESVSLLKILGILIALFSIYMVTVNPEKMNQKASLLFPLLVFIGSGFIDASLKYLETTYVKAEDVSLFSAIIFGSALCCGIIVLGFEKINGNFKFEFKNTIGGLALGIVNYYSVYFLIKAISAENTESSTVFTINNVAILLISTILGTIFFKEKLSSLNKIGIAFASISIVLVSFSSNF